MDFKLNVDEVTKNLHDMFPEVEESKIREMVENINIEVTNLIVRANYDLLTEKVS